MKQHVVIWRMLLGVLALASASVYGGENDEGFNWLKVVIFAEHQTNYSGVSIYQYGDHVDTSSITHLVDMDGENEKIESLDEPKREIVRHHGQVWSHAGHDVVEVDSQQRMGKFPSLLPEQLSVMGENYQAKLMGIEKVAGYNAQVILFQPKDDLRYSHKIWVHTDSGLLLKAAVLAGKHKLVEQYSFAQLQIGGKIDRSWVKLRTPSDFKGEGVNNTQEAARVGFPVNSGWTADVLPDGYRKSMEIQRPMHGNHAPVTQIVFTDGLSAISVFIELDDGDEDDMESLSSRGAMSLYHKVVGKHLFTVVGEVPPHTVMRVLDSIRYNGK